MSRHRRQQLRRARALAERLHQAELHSPETRAMIHKFAAVMRETSPKPGDIDDSYLFPGLGLPG